MMSLLQFILGLLAPFICLAATVLITLLWGRKKIQQQISLRYTVRDPKGIEVLAPVKIGGIKQWLHIRGRNLENPVLLQLHGGGFSNIGWFDEIQRPWEEHFTVVQWDQRTGKSYQSLKKAGHTITHKQMIKDTEDVISHLRCVLKKDKIFLLGKSYGSYLGMQMVKRHPDWLHAYIGDGQMVNVVDYLESEYEHLLCHAKHQKNKALVARLENISPRIDPNNRWGSFMQHEPVIWEELSRIGKCFCRFMMPSEMIGGISFSKYLSPHLTIMDLMNPIMGDSFATKYPEAFSKEFMAIDLPGEIGSNFEVPIFLFTGAHDWHVPHTYQKAWFDSIAAPYKELVSFNNSAHYPYLDEPGRYAEALINRVYPFRET